LLKVSLALARSALEAAPDAMLMIDEAGINRFPNLQASAFFGFSREAVIGLRVEDLRPERFRSRHAGHPIKPEPTDFTVASIFDEMRAEFASIAANKGLQLQIESCADCVHSDRSLVE